MRDTNRKSLSEVAEGGLDVDASVLDLIYITLGLTLAPSSLLFTHHLCLQLTGMVGDGSIEGRQALEGAVGSKGRPGRSMKGKAFIAKGKNSRLGNLPKKKF